MKSIVVPIDFSKTSVCGLIYAFNWANQTGSSVRLLHFINKRDAVILERRTQKLASFVNEKIEKHGLPKSVKYSIDVEYISSVFDINELDAVISSELFITATKGKVKSFFWKKYNNSSDFAENLRIPVLVIPSGYTFKSIETILFFSDFEKLKNNKSLQNLNAIAHNMNSKIKITHVKTSKENHEKSTMHKKELELEKVLIGEDLLSSVNVIKSNSIVEGIKSYLSNKPENNVVAMIHRPDTFWKKIFNAGLTKQIIFNTTRPVLVLK